MSTLLVLITSAAATAILGAMCSLRAITIKNKRGEIAGMLEASLNSPMRRPDNMAGDAMTLSLINQDDARITAKDRTDSLPWNLAAIGFGVLSAVLSLGAGLTAS